MERVGDPENHSVGEQSLLYFTEASSMSRFYANIKGNRSPVTCRGDAKSGVSGHLRGWDIGVYVEAYVDEQGDDAVRVEITGGSNRTSSLKKLGTFKISNGSAIQIA
jgi:hypothetical protein